MELTEVNEDDAGSGGQMLESIAQPIERVRGEGGYDQRKFYQTCAASAVSDAHVGKPNSAIIVALWLTPRSLWG